MNIPRRIHNLLHPKVGCILMLHRVTEESATNMTSRHMAISTSDLEKLVKGYQQRGWRFVSMDEVVNHAPFNSHHSPFVCLTFDDGYLDTYSTAYPLLSSMEIPFCVYMTRDFYRGTATPQWDNGARMMNIEHLLEFSHNPLCTIGAHTCSHPRLSRLKPDEMQCEIKDSKNDLEQLLGKEIRHFAYPHGDYNQDTVNIVKELGFASAVTTSGRYVRNDSQLLELDRLVTF